MFSPFYCLTLLVFMLADCEGAEINQHKRVTRETDVGETLKKFVHQISDGISDETQRAIEFGMRVMKEVIQVIQRVFNSEEYQPFIDETAKQIANGAELAASLGHKIVKGIMRDGEQEIDDDPSGSFNDQNSPKAQDRITQDA